MLKPGDQAPDFEVPLDSGQVFVLSHHRGRHIILYFYPKDSTPGCTVEATDFTRLSSRFRAAGATVLGLSKDGACSHRKFRADHQLGVELGSDEDGKVAGLYGVIRERLRFGKRSVGLIRSTFWIGRDGVVLRVWSPVRVAGHAQAVLDAVEKG